MTKYQEKFSHATSFIKKLLKIKMVTLLLGHPAQDDLYKRRFFMSYMSMTIYNIYFFLFIIVYIVCIIIYLLILYVGIC